MLNDRWWKIFEDQEQEPLKKESCLIEKPFDPDLWQGIGYLTHFKDYKRKAYKNKN